MKLSRVFLPLVSLGLILAGCAGGPKPGGIVETVTNLRVDSAEGKTGMMTIEYTNENTIPLGFSGSTNKLYLNDRYVGRGESKTPFGLAPLKQGTQDVRIVFENSDVVRQLFSAGPHAVPTFRIESVLHQKVADDHVEIKISGEGSVTLESR